MVLGRPLGAPHWKFTTENTSRHWAKLDILGVDNNPVPLQE